jgi:diguanylate cyclase (GGDEF)-like protein/PAS domain S-box-containing protein
MTVSFLPKVADEPAAGSDIVAQAAMYRIIIENSADVIVRYNAARRRIFVSPAVRKMLGYEPEEFIRINPDEIMHPADFARVDPSFQRFIRDHISLELTFRLRRKDGQYIWVEAQNSYVPEDGGSIAVLRDVNSRKIAEAMLEQANQTLQDANEALRRLAQQDGLTGLANRRRFDELLELEFRRSGRERTPLAVLLLDVDCFKAYNDRYGHLAGDECLRRISRAIEGVLKRPADHLARYGGEEFVALLPATDLAGATARAEAIRSAVSDLAIEHLGSAYGVATISIGVCAVISGQDSAPSELVAAADRALYQAKSDGRNCVRVDCPHAAAGG